MKTENIKMEHFVKTLLEKVRKIINKCEFCFIGPYKMQLQSTNTPNFINYSILIKRYLKKSNKEVGNSKENYIYFFKKDF
jgi:hypothetical protein